MCGLGTNVQAQSKRAENPFSIAWCKWAKKYSWYYQQHQPYRMVRLPGWYVCSSWVEWCLYRKMIFKPGPPSELRISLVSAALLLLVEIRTDQTCPKFLVAGQFMTSEILPLLQVTLACKGMGILSSQQFSNEPTRLLLNLQRYDHAHFSWNHLCSSLS